LTSLWKYLIENRRAVGESHRRQSFIRPNSSPLQQRPYVPPPMEVIVDGFWSHFALLRPSDPLCLKWQKWTMVIALRYTIISLLVSAV
jgi:hypothetical protein